MTEMGRPPVEIDKEQFEKLCRLQMPEWQIADYFECSEDTINRWCKKNYTDEFGEPMTFAEVRKKKSAKMMKSLRIWQFDSAKKGNVTMQIWLGKQYLGQSDNPENSVDQEDTDAYFDEAGI